MKTRLLTAIHIDSDAQEVNKIKLEPDFKKICALLHVKDVCITFAYKHIIYVDANGNDNGTLNFFRLKSANTIWIPGNAVIFGIADNDFEINCKLTKTFVQNDIVFMSCDDKHSIPKAKKLILFTNH